MPRFTTTNPMSLLFAQETEKSEQCRLYHLIVLDNIKSETSSEPALHLVDSNYDVTYSGQLYERFPLKFSGISVSTDGSIDKASITVANASRELMDLLDKYDGLSGCTVSVITVYERFLDYTYHTSVDGVLSTAVNAGSDITAHIRDEYVIDSYVATEQSITFQLNSVVDFNIRVPRRRFTPFSCYWRYRDSDTCGYSGEVTLIRSGGAVLLPYNGSTADYWVGKKLILKRTGYADVPATVTASVDGVGVASEVGVLLTLSPVPVWSVGTEVTVVQAECRKSLEDCHIHNNSDRFGGFPGVPSDVRSLYL